MTESEWGKYLGTARMKDECKGKENTGPVKGSQTSNANSGLSQ